MFSYLTTCFVINSLHNSNFILYYYVAIHDSVKTTTHILSPSVPSCRVESRCIMQCSRLCVNMDYMAQRSVCFLT